MAHGAEEIQSHIKVYISVFAALMVLTIVTVAISYLHLSKGPAIALGLAVATIKASLVALFFMHLNDERKVIYWLLGLAAFFFAVCLTIPISWYNNEVRLPEVWDTLPAEGGGGHHGGGHDDHGDEAAHGDGHH